MESSTTNKRVLVTPMNWGLGHAARCIPVIDEVMRQGQEVMIATDGAAASLLKQKYPHIKQLRLPGYDIRYSSNPFLLMLKFPVMVLKVLISAYSEHREIKRIISKYNIDIVISDQRFGCYFNKVFSVYISHQFCVKMPKAFAPIEYIVWSTLFKAAERFDQVWIPDFPEDRSLTGDLTNKYPLPEKHIYIGPLSRFEGENSIETEGSSDDTSPDIFVIISGPEPQRSIFEDNILSQLKSYQGRACVLRGKPGSSEIDTGNNKSVKIYSHLPDTQFEKLLRKSGSIIARGGYTTIMDLVKIRKRAVLVPTPGQTEQEYLCRFLSEKGLFLYKPQKGFSLSNALKDLREYSFSEIPEWSGKDLEKAVKSIIDKI